MDKVRLLYSKRIPDLEQFVGDELGSMIESAFDSKRGFGFYGTDIHDDTIESTLVYTTVFMQRIFDAKTRSLVSRKQPTIHEVPFLLDCYHGLLHVYVGGKRLQRLVSILGQLSNSRITIEDVYLNLADFIKRLDKRDLTYKITRLSIENFRPTSGLSGRFEASVIEQRAARNIVKVYGADVTDISVEVTVDDETVVWRVSSTGRIAVRAEEDLIGGQVDLVREVALGVNNA